jgi:hypothetical protein
VATFNARLAVGTHTVQAIYDGDAGNSGSTSSSQAATVRPGQQPQDFNLDGKADLLWFRASDRSATTWLMNGVTVDPNSPSFGQGAAGYEVIGTGDFDGDGKSDLLWYRASDRSLSIQFSGGTTVPVGQIGVPWELRGIADVNGDGKADLIWYNPQDRSATAWWMNGAQIDPNSTGYGQDAAGNELIGVGDFDGDGKADLLWYRASDRFLTIQFTGGVSTGVGQIGAPYELRAIADLNGDGKADLLWINPLDRTASGWWMVGAQIDPASRGYGQGPVGSGRPISMATARRMCCGTALPTGCSRCNSPTATTPTLVPPARTGCCVGWETQAWLGHEEIRSSAPSATRTSTATARATSCGPIHPTAPSMDGS